MNPAIGHTVKTATDVAATFHLEPSHNPKAGEPATIWFALTKAGGQPIPLSDCDCQLAVKQGETPIAIVPLKAITAEQYQGIPGGEMVFPQVGIYQLIFSGKAKDEQAFQPFELKYEVTVQPGKVAIPTDVSMNEKPFMEIRNDPGKPAIIAINLYAFNTGSIETTEIPLIWVTSGLFAAGAIGYWLVRGRDR
jgi:hypothetical protein